MSSAGWESKVSPLTAPRAQIATRADGVLGECQRPRLGRLTAAAAMCCTTRLAVCAVSADTTGDDHDVVVEIAVNECTSEPGTARSSRSMPDEAPVIKAEMCCRCTRLGSPLRAEVVAGHQV